MGEFSKGKKLVKGWKARAPSPEQKRWKKPKLVHRAGSP